MSQVDELIVELQRERRHRMVLVVAAVIGIVASAMTGIGFALSGMGAGAGARNPGALLFFVGPFALAMGIGYAVYGLLRWRSRR
jgi:hypothetical protein